MLLPRKYFSRFCAGGGNRSKADSNGSSASSPSMQQLNRRIPGRPADAIPDPFLPEHQLFTVAGEQLGPIFDHAEVADHHALGRAGDEGVDAPERCVHEKRGRGGRPHVLVASGEAVPYAAGLAGKQACRGEIADMMRGMAGRDERRDAVRGKALRGDEALRRDRIERAVTVGHGAQNLPGAFPQLGRVDQMGDALFVADDPGLGGTWRRPGRSPRRGRGGCGSEECSPTA